MPRVRLMSLFNYLWLLDCCFFGSDPRTGTECGIVASSVTCNLMSLEKEASVVRVAHVLLWNLLSCMSDPGSALLQT